MTELQCSIHAVSTLTAKPVLSFSLVSILSVIIQVRPGLINASLVQHVQVTETGFLQDEYSSCQQSYSVKPLITESTGD